MCSLGHLAVLTIDLDPSVVPLKSFATYVSPHLPHNRGAQPDPFVGLAQLEIIADLSSQ